MAHYLVEDFAVGAGARVPEMPAPGSSADAAIDVDDFVPPPRPVRRREAPRALTPPLANVPREPIVLSDSDDDEFDPEAAHDEIMFGAAADEPGPSRPRRPQHPRPQRRALFSPPPPAPPAGPPPPPVPAIPERLRNLRTSLHHMFMRPLEELGELPLPRPFGGLFQQVPHLPAPNPFPPPPPPGLEQRAGLGLGGYILRQAAQNFGRGGRNIRFTFDFGLGPGAAGVDAEGWQRYDEELFERIDRAAAGPPAPQYKREFLFKDPLAPGFTADFAPPEPPPAPKVFDVETGEEVVDKGKRKADAPQRLLVCAKCVDPLRGAQSARDRRVWALRCGHVLDGRCLAALAEDADLAAAHTTAAPTPLESAAGPARTVKQTARRGKGRGAVRGRKPPPPPEPETLVLAEREWACPVPRCGKPHWSQLVRKGEHGAPTWVPKPGCGAIQVFA